jgi:hypothetical protein
MEKKHIEWTGTSVNIIMYTLKIVALIYFIAYIIGQYKELGVVISFLSLSIIKLGNPKIMEYHEDRETVSE